MSLPPYGEYKAGVILVLRACVIINDVPAVARCYLRYTPPKVDVKIVGNEWREVNVRKKTTLDGSQTRDLSRPFVDFSTKTFLWSCRSKDDPRNRYCRSHMSDRPVIRLPANVLRKGSEYLFTLAVSSRENPGFIQTARQFLMGVSNKTITLNIRCISNCDYGVFSSDESVQLRAECQDCTQPIVRYEWWLKTLEEKLESESESEETLLSESQLAVFYYDYKILSIRLRVGLRSNMSAEAYYTLRRNEGPNGTCTVSPSSGIEAVTTFEINCRGFKTEFEPLYYRYVTPSTGIIEQSQFARYETYLTETEEIEVLICDVIDKCTIQTLNVNVKPFMFKKIKAKPKQRITAILRNVKDLINRGLWDNAMSRSLAAVTYTKSANDGNIIFDSLLNQETVSGPQLERLAILTTQLINYLISLDYEDVRLLGRIFKQMSRIFMVIVSQREEVHPDAYYTLTAMHMYYISTLGVQSEAYSVAMCSPYNAECLYFEKVRLMHRNIGFDSLILYKINQWMMATWYLYKCVYFLGILGSRQQNPYHEALSVRQGGISYQMNLTQVNDGFKPLIVKTIDNSHIIKLSAKLLQELRTKLNHDEVLFQIISQRNHHHLYWWYPYPMPAKTNVLIIHAYSRNGYLWFGNKSRLENPVIYKTDLSRFSDNENFNVLTSNGSIGHPSEMHFYKMMLDNKAVLAVRIVNVSEPIHINMRLHRRPTSQELEKHRCIITPKMGVYRFGNISANQKLQNYMACDGTQFKFDPNREVKEEILLVIVTGGQEFAGTTSNINIYLKSPRQPQHMYQIIQDPGHPRLLRNTTNKMQVPRGYINIPTRLALGIDRNGRYPSWYCRTITVIDLELKRHQLFVVERWIERGHTRYIRSKYFPRGGREFIPQYTWWKRFRNRFEQLYYNWFCDNPVTGPWQSSIGGWTLNRIERTAVLISKLAITFTLALLSPVSQVPMFLVYTELSPTAHVERPRE
ncbi:uncharacterized protein LOC110185905 [Drosophila serrata]|uniref:uncharacterized protein LOC110185905 n=1 Tax=Drosophila serrata TaxID=7274 RepID=UPI000A1D2965|nr:uncharacterized protein LOC110185905 [Drosophila serrata]